MPRIPVHLVSGAPGTGKSALIAAFARERANWLGLVNVLPVACAANLRLLSAGCPCCTGRVVLQVSLVRALRETRATRAFVELPDAAHVPRLAKQLGELPFSLSVFAARGIVLPRDVGIRAAALEAGQAAE